MIISKQTTNISPKFIGTWFPPGANWNPKRIESLANLVKLNGGGIPRVPVYKLHNNFINTKHQYLLADGHKRRVVFSILGMELPCVVYSPEEIINPFKDNLDPFEFLGNSNGSEHYTEVFRLYQDPTIVERWIANRNESKWDKNYLKKLIL